MAKNSGSIIDPRILALLEEGYKSSMNGHLDTDLEDILGQVSSIDVVDFFNWLPGESVDLVVSDDDYAAADTRWSPNARKARYTQFDWFVGQYPTFAMLPYIPHAVRSLKPGGILVAFGFPEWATAWRDIITHFGLQMRAHRVWFKTNATPQFRGKNWATAHECIWIASKGSWSPRVLESRVRHNWTAETACPHCRARYPFYLSNEWDHPEWFSLVDEWEKAEEVPEFSGPPWRSSICPSCGRQHGVWLTDRADQMAFDLALRQQYISGLSSEPTREHPTKKPDWLIRELIHIFTEPGGVVVDGMCGQGTTLVAAKKMGRQWAGNDLDEKWAAFARVALAGTQKSIGGFK